MRVSVLIPTYNSEKHLSECLDSVLAQDFPDMEILISDNCSTDTTPAIIQQYATRDARIRWWQNPENLGLVGNHNVCLRQAVGEYIKFVHADDKLLTPSAIRQLVTALDENPSATLAGCRQHLTGTKAKPWNFFTRPGIYHGRETIIANLERNTNLIGQPALTLFRRAAAKRGFDPRFVGHLDFEMWCHLLEQGDFVYVPTPLATWRVHETQQTATNEKTKSATHEQLILMETYYARPWLRAAATRRMLFVQIYQFKKRQGPAAAPLIAAMMEQLSAPQYAWQWLRYKIRRPFEKARQKFTPA